MLGSLENDVGIIASRKAWWQLGTIDFDLFRKDFNISVPAGASLFAIVFAMVKHFLPISDEDCLQIVRQRLQDPLCHDTTCDALHEIEEAVQVLDREDEQMVHNAKEDDFKRRERKQVFKDGYRAKAQELFAKNWWATICEEVPSEAQHEARGCRKNDPC